MIKATGDIILVKFVKINQSKGGIIVPENASTGEPQGYGEILSIGEEVPDTLKEGNIVVFHNMSGQLLTSGKKVFRVLRYSEMYGVLTDDDVKKQLEDLVLERPSEKRIITA